MIAEVRRMGPAGEAWHSKVVATGEQYGAVDFIAELPQDVLVLFSANAAFPLVEREAFEFHIWKIDDEDNVCGHLCCNVLHGHTDLVGA